MTPELKAAAEEYRTGGVATKVFAAVTLADAYLAEHDDTPVAGDEQWLREQGGEISEHGLCRLGKLLITDSCLFINDPDQDQQWIMDNPTRGDVLMLLHVVGKGE